MKNIFALPVQILFILAFINDGISSDSGSYQKKTTEILFIKDDNSTGQSYFYQDIVGLGYNVDVTSPVLVTIEKLLLYNLVVLSTGNSPYACQESNMRLAIQSFILKENGKVIIEGGHTGYISDVFPFYLGFRNKVIKIDNWVTDEGRDLNVATTHSFSALATSPHILPNVININYNNIHDQDVCTVNKFSELFYSTSLYSEKAGILVAPSVKNPQVINYFVYYNSFSDRDVAKKLLDNSIYNLIGKPVSIINISAIIPKKFDLFQNYPNPFNPSTKIRFDVRSENNMNASYIKITVYNSSGKKISMPVNGNFQSGSYEVNFNSDNLSGGIYFYKLEAVGYSMTRKMILIK